MSRFTERDSRTYCFGECRFIPDRQLLTLGSEPLRVGARALALLHKLVLHAGEVVNKDELIDFVWPDTFVHDSNLKVNIAALRRALPRTSSGQSCIATVSGSGYRFVAPLRVYGDDQPRSAGDPAEVSFEGLPEIPEVIGRDEVIADAAMRLPEYRLLTIVGPAGVGKTTVAVAMAKRLLARYRDGICFVDLTTIGDPQLVDVKIAGALGVGSKWANMLAGIVQTLRDRNILLLLDNCEHVLSTASAMAEHLTTALPDLHILATSREPLRSRAEEVYRLPPLSFPDEDRGRNRTDAVAFPAVDLFVRRAGEACGYQLDDADAPVVAAICGRLDGLPLAIELAASRLPAFGAGNLLQRLEDNFDLLNAGTSAPPSRHKTLHATLDWSYQLLSRKDAQLLRMLSVFSTRFSLADVLGVVGQSDWSVEAVTASTESLASKSLLSVVHTAQGRHYRLLHSTRGFAADRLAAAGEAAQARSSHAIYMLSLMERAETEWQWQPRHEWTATYGPRTNDLRDAIDWAFGDGNQPQIGVRLTSAAIPLWDELSSVAESRRRVDYALKAKEVLRRCDPAVKMKLLASYASGLNFSDHFGPEADAAWTEANRLAREIENIDYQLRTLWGLGILQSFTGRHFQAVATLDEFARLAGGEEQRPVFADGERVRLMAVFYRGDVARSYVELKQLVREHAATARRSGVAQFQIDRFVSARVALAVAAWVSGDSAEAAMALKEAMRHSVAVDHIVSHTNALAQAALPLALWSGDLEGARAHVATLDHNLTLREIGIWRPVCEFYDGAVRCYEGDIDGIDRMHRAIERLIANNFVVRVPYYLAMLAEAALAHGRISLASESLGAAFDRADRQGEYWSQAELLRVRALLQRRHGNLNGADETLLMAIETARNSGALFFQLRAATTLAEFWSEAGRHRAAADLLAPICAEFNRIRPFADLAKAHRLLDMLTTPDRRAAQS